MIEGEVGIRVGDETVNAAPGAYVIKPRGIPHTHWNAARQPARVMEITTPGEFESFFDDLGTLLAAGGPPDPAALNEIGERHGRGYSSFDDALGADETAERDKPHDARRLSFATPM